MLFMCVYCFSFNILHLGNLLKIDQKRIRVDEKTVHLPFVIITFVTNCLKHLSFCGCLFYTIFKK